MAARTRLPLQSFLSIKDHFISERIVHTEAAAPEPVYPPIVASLTAKSKSAQRRQIEERVKTIHASPVEEKLRLLTKIQFKKYVVYPQTFALNADKWYQHFTKTAYIPGLPEKFSIVSDNKNNSPPPLGIGEDAFAEIRDLVTNAILQENWHMKKRKPFTFKEQDHFVSPFLRNLVTGVTNAVAKHNPVLLLSSLDLKPQVHFYWKRGERTIPRGHRRGRLEPIRFQIDDHPHSQIRIPQQLPQFTTIEASYAAEVPESKLSPDLMPLFKRQYDNNIFTGAKLPAPECYGHTQFHLVPDRYRRDILARRTLADQVEPFLRSNAMASLFAWTGAQAMYQGFWTRDDVSRPFVSQAVITDGQFFSFFCYQLNTLALCTDTDPGNPRKNLLWGTESLRLHGGVRDGSVVDLDDNILRLLVQLLMNGP